MRVFVLIAMWFTLSAAWADNDALREAQRREYQRCMDTALRESPSGAVDKEDEELCVNEASVKAWLRTPSAKQETAPQAAQQDFDKARQRVSACLQKQIAKLDDGVSPASDIARAVKGSCTDELGALGGVYTGLNFAQRSRIIEDVALGETLAFRASKRKK